MQDLLHGSGDRNSNNNNDNLFHYANLASENGHLGFVKSQIMVDGKPKYARPLSIAALSMRGKHSRRAATQITRPQRGHVDHLCAREDGSQIHSWPDRPPWAASLAAKSGAI